MTQDQDTCLCPTPWPRLTTLIEQREYTVTPAQVHSPASALYLAHCATCRTPYTRPWKQTPRCSIRLWGRHPDSAIAATGPWRGTGP
ncbi:hypothetical protein [Streptomyces sp. NPDC005167]